MIITTTFDSEHWQVVPKVATPEMLEAGDDSGFQSYNGSWLVTPDSSYNAMLAAAPPAPGAWLPPDQAIEGEYALAIVEPDYATCDNNMVYGSMFSDNGKWLVNDYDHYCYPVVCFMRPTPPEQAGGKVES